MAWWEGVDEKRILIAHGCDPDSSGNNAGQVLLLRHPKSGNSTCYLYTNGMLQELHWFKQSYGSWFLGDYICEDGRMHMATPVDPVFVMLPIFDEARMKKGDDHGKFRQLDEILFISSYPGYQQLLSLVENCMQVVCEIKEVGSLKFYRLDDSKVLAWLYHKVCQLKQTLLALDQNYAAQDEKDTLTDAVSILAEYLKPEPWLKLFCDHLKLDLTETAKKGPDVEAFSTAYESSPRPTNILPEKTEKVRTRAGRQTKKPKMETESKNIKDMFRRASKRGS